MADAVRNLADDTENTVSEDSVIHGTPGDDWLWGDAGDDILKGGRDNDELNGGDGNDILNGGLGNDELYGGAGEDTFIFKKSSEEDTIKDFEVGNDLVWIQSGAKNFNDLELTNTNNGLLIEFGDVDIILENLDRNDISSSDFDFG